MITRRGIFGLLAGAFLDPEKLLWKPGKLISIPKPVAVVIPVVKPLSNSGYLMDITVCGDTWRRYAWVEFD